MIVGKNVSVKMKQNIHLQECLYANVPFNIKEEWSTRVKRARSP